VVKEALKSTEFSLKEVVSTFKYYLVHVIYMHVNLDHMKNVDEMAVIRVVKKAFDEDGIYLFNNY
jgi:hypothetical protein